MAVVYIFIVDAGCMSASAFDLNSVSPRESETTIAPHCPLRVRDVSAAPRSLASASASRGEVQTSRGGLGAAATVRPRTRFFDTRRLAEERRLAFLSSAASRLARLTTALVSARN